MEHFKPAAHDAAAKRSFSPTCSGSTSRTSRCISSAATPCSTSFNESTNMGMGSVLGNASLIKKSIRAQVHFSHQPRGVQLCEPAVQPGGHPAGHAYHPLAVLLDDSARLGTAFAAAGVLLRHGRAAFGAGGLLPRPAIPVRYPDDGMDVRYTAVLSPLALPPFMVPVIQAEPAVPLHQLHALPCHVRHGARPQHLDRLHRQCRGHDERRAGRVP